MSVNPPGFSGGDRTSLDMPAEEDAVLKAVKATGKKLVVVLMNGSALSVNWASNNADAIIDAWYPGEEGGTAVAETLADDRVVAPGGYQISIGEGQPAPAPRVCAAASPSPAPPTCRNKPAYQQCFGRWYTLSRTTKEDVRGCG